LFVDGLGLGVQDARINPLASGVCPNLETLLRGHAVPVDASMGVEGLPQSATGQTALLTGINAARTVGRHVEGFPGQVLREILRCHNIFIQMRQAGLRCTFANAYFVHESAEVVRASVHSATTVAALSAFGGVRTRQDLERNAAVYQDLTRESLRSRGYDGRLITPQEAAEHLAEIALDYELTLFEYFQTDRAGHSRDFDRARTVLATFDIFLGALLARVNPNEELLVLTSDHGNIEDLRVGGHTLNPVPLVAVGKGAEQLLNKVRSIVDVTPQLLALWC